MSRALPRCEMLMKLALGLASPLTLRLARPHQTFRRVYESRPEQWMLSASFLMTLESPSSLPQVSLISLHTLWLLLSYFFDSLLLLMPTTQSPFPRHTS